MDDAIKFGLVLALGYALGIATHEIQKSAYVSSLESQNSHLKTEKMKVDKQIDKIKEVVEAW